jgi:hypothetical protein
MATPSLAKLCRHVTHHPSLGHQTGRAGPLHPQPASPTPSSGPSPPTASPGARSLLGHPPRREDTHHAALRALGNRLVGLHQPRTHTLYDENIAWGLRAESGMSKAGTIPLPRQEPAAAMCDPANGPSDSTKLGSPAWWYGARHDVIAGHLLAHQVSRPRNVLHRYLWTAGRQTRPPHRHRWT